MPPVVESNGTGAVTGTGDTTLVITAPSGIADGDILVAFTSISNGRSWTGYSGWTAAHTTHYGGLFYKTAASESGNYTFTADGSFLYATGVIVRVSGAETPDATARAAESNWDTSLDCPNITTTDDNSLVLWGGCQGALTPLSYDSSDRGTLVQTTACTSALLGHVVYKEDVATAGLQTGAVITMSGSATSKDGLAISIPPAAAAATTITPAFITISDKYETFF